MRKKDEAYYHDLLRRVKELPNGGDAVAFINEQDFCIGLYSLEEVLFNPPTQYMNKVIANDCELIIFWQTHDSKDEKIFKQGCELEHQMRLIRFKYHCHPKWWLLDSDRDLVAVERIQKDWGNMWEFLPILLRSESEYEQLMQKIKIEIKRQEELDKLKAENHEKALQELSDTCLEVFGKAIDKDKFYPI
ncbi:MAG: hypothetical protein EPN82_05810 [Bacteroidetes bacterium]|nr:MAG: hypothetical protein EPN82_05810 [Bacteroidota bacterium]